MTEIVFNTPEPVSLNIQQGVPFAASLASLAALGPEHGLAYLRPGPYAFIWRVQPAPADVLVEQIMPGHLLCRNTILQRSDDTPSGVDQLSFKFVVVANPTAHANTGGTGWLMPGSLIAAASALPSGWAPVNASPYPY
ncbi:hypothetical protein [Nitratireductor soli]|uniref:hypothetical protein n=1 Tax=Nitratireductor soli TaxID=1670619 RepID=UPI000B1DC8B6|nr:hypothetical protein [Nitratireductor soli]